MNKNIITSYYAFFMSGLTSMILSSILPFLIVKLSMNYSQAGMLLSVLSIGNMVSAYFIGFVINRKDIRFGGILVAALNIIGLLIIANTKIWGLAVIGFVLVGICRGGISNLSNTIVNYATNGDGAKLNYLHMFFSLGACVGPLLAALATRFSIKWEVLIVMAVVLNAGTLILFARNQNVGINVGLTQKNKCSDRKGFIAEPIFIICAFVLFCYIGTENSVNGWLVTYFEGANILSVELAQSMLSLLYFVMFLGRLISAKLTSKVSVTRLMFVSSICALLAYALMINCRREYVIVLLVGLIGFFFAPMYPYAISICSETLKGDAIAMGTLLTIGGLGKIILPMWVGQISDYAGIGLGMGSILIALFLLVVSVSILLVRNGECERKKENEYI